jgi:hypothetical protein
MGKALDLIKKLEVREFDWKHNDQHDIGLIAEEVAQVIPEAVFYNNEGQIEGLKPLTLIAILVKALQELQEV